MDLATADVPRRPAADRQPPGPQTRTEDPQEHARQAGDAVSRKSMSPRLRDHAEQ